MPTKTTTEPGIDIDMLSMGIWAGAINPLNLPLDVYLYNANILKKGLYTGFKKSFIDLNFHDPDYALLNNLRTSVYKFSAAKTFQQVLQMNKQLHTLTTHDHTPTFNEFKRVVTDISDEYNKTWLATEYNTVITRGQNASAWNRFEQQKDVLPYLQKVVTEDENTCEICAPLDGLTAPVDDPCWDTLAGDLHFNCRCYEIQLDEDADPDSQEDINDLKDSQTALMDPMFKTNVGKTQTLFNGKTPYFQVPEKYKDLLKINFHLPLPRNDN